MTVAVHSLPNVTISGDNDLCVGENTTLTAYGASGYRWSNNANSSTNASVIVTPSFTTTYTVTGTNQFGCTDTASIPVTVHSLPNVTVSGDNDLCYGESTTLTASGANSYLWSSNANSNTNDSVIVTPATATIYSVTGTDLNGCSAIANVTVSVHDLPTVTISGDNGLCAGENTTLIASGASTYLWSGNTNDSTNAVVTISPPATTTYTVTGTNQYGCTSTASINIDVYPLPQIIINGDTSICSGESTILTANGAEQYSWNIGEHTASINVSSFGIYTVTGTSVSGCHNTASAVVTVSMPPTIYITGNTDICQDESTTLYANGGVIYIWNNGSSDASLTVNTAGTYQVIGTDENGCTNSASATVNIWDPQSSEFSVSDTACYLWNDIEYCESGDYTQTLQTIHGCDSIVTLHLSVITVGVKDFTPNSDMRISIYPNPTFNILHIKVDDEFTRLTNAEIYDAIGRKVKTVRWSEVNTIQKIDMEEFSSGMYFIRLYNDDQCLGIRKLIKRK